MLSSTIALKPVSESAENFVAVVSNLNDGVTRRNTAVARPNKSELLIRHQPRNSGSKASTAHIISLLKTEDDAAGVIYPYVASLTLTVPDNAAVTNAMVYDSIRQLIDLLATTAPVTLDTSIIDSILAGEA
jgi:hypothetical protein